MVFETQLILQFHPIYRSSHDKVFDVRCFYGESERDKAVKRIAASAPSSGNSTEPHSYRARTACRRSASRTAPPTRRSSASVSSTRGSATGVQLSSDSTRLRILPSVAVDVRSRLLRRRSSPQPDAEARRRQWVNDLRGTMSVAVLWSLRSSRLPPPPPPSGRRPPPRPSPLPIPRNSASVVNFLSVTGNSATATDSWCLLPS